MKKIDPRVAALTGLAEITPKICLDKKTAGNFSRGMLIILQKTLHSIFGDIWECVEFYHGSRKKFEEEAVPFLTEIQILVYLADIVVEDLQDSLKVNRCIKAISKTIYQRIEERGIKDKKIIPLMEEVYQFLLTDRRVRDKKLILKKDKILEVLNFKVSDLVALMRIAAELSGCGIISEDEWQIWRQFELMREFIDDQEDRDEDIKEYAEQFNSIVQLERQGIEIKRVINGESKRLTKLISKVADINKRKKFIKITDELINNRLPQNFDL